MTGHSIRKLNIFAAEKLMDNCIHEVNYNTVKNTAVYRVNE